MKTHARATLTSAVVLTAVFASGTMVGRAWDRGTGDEPAATEPDTASAETPTPAERRPPMYEQVGLTDGQRVLVDSIVVHYRQDVRELQRTSRESYEREYMVLVDAVRESIKGVMTSDQRAQYDSLLTASDERRRARREERERSGSNDE